MAKGKGFLDKATKAAGKLLSENKDAIFAAASAAAAVRGDQRAVRMIAAAERAARLAENAPDLVDAMAMRSAQLVEETVRQVPSLIEDFFAGRIRIVREPKKK